MTMGLGLLPNSPLFRAFFFAHEPHVPSTIQGKKRCSSQISKKRSAALLRALTDHVAQTDRSPESSPERALHKVVDDGLKKASKKVHRKNNPDCGSQEISFFPLESQWD